MLIIGIGLSRERRERSALKTLATVTTRLGAEHTYANLSVRNNLAKVQRYRPEHPVVYAPCFRYAVQSVLNTCKRVIKIKPSPAWRAERNQEMDRAFPEVGLVLSGERVGCEFVGLLRLEPLLPASPCVRG